jgi:hypothetical protein
MRPDPCSHILFSSLRPSNQTLGNNNENVQCQTNRKFVVARRLVDPINPSVETRISQKKLAYSSSGNITVPTIFFGMQDFLDTGAPDKLLSLRGFGLYEKICVPNRRGQRILA